MTDRLIQLAEECEEAARRHNLNIDRDTAPGSVDTFIERAKFDTRLACARRARELAGEGEREQSAPPDDLEEEPGLRVYASGLDLWMFRCPSCGTTGPPESWCKGHAAPLEAGGGTLSVRREPVLVPHADPPRARTRIDAPPADQEQREEGSDG